MLKIPPCFYRISIKALITNSDGELLVLEEPSGLHDLPGGGLEFGEDFKTGLARELFEETGLVIATLENHPSYFYTFLNPKQIYLANVVYKVTITSLNFTPTNECSAIRFFSPKYILENKEKFFNNVVELATQILEEKPT